MRSKSSAKRVGFVALAILLPFVLLVGLEFGLRAVGVGEAERSVFTTVEGHEEYQILNTAYLKRHFNDRFEPTVAYNPFRKQKAEGAFRVIVLGGSSTAGYPYRFYLGFPARLQQRLEAYAAGQPVEVINLGITAANSYSLWDIKEAVAAQQPDAVVIYAGHNEYYGAFGAGSSINALADQVWLKRAVLKLKKSVLYTALERLLSPDPAGDRRSLMAQSVGDAAIELDGPVYLAGIAQYEANMREVLETFKATGIPVYMGTVASNLKDQVPLGDDEEALARFFEGRDLILEGDTLAARATLLVAKERDEIRFRAPEAINEVIRGFGKDGLAEVVEMQPVAAKHSDSGVEDYTFFLDHLHPSHVGYEYFASAFFDALKGHPTLRPSGRVPAETFVKPDAFERTFGVLQVFSIEVGFPFNKNASPEEEALSLTLKLREYSRSNHYLDSLSYRFMTNEIGYEEALDAALSIAKSKGDTLNTLHHYRSLLYSRPFDAVLREDATTFAGEVKNPRYTPLADEILLHAANRTGDDRYLRTLASR